MQRCDLTGISCEGRELLQLPENPPLWVAPTVKMLLMRGLNLHEVRETIKNFEGRMGSMTAEQRKKFFVGSARKVV
jgi:hypothetical protein